MRRLALTWVMVLALCGSVEAGKALAPEDFAFGLPIEAHGEGAVFEVVLPVEFYLGLTRRDLRDFMVFNGQREPVPYAIRQLSEEDAPQVPVHSLPVFAIPGEPAGMVDGLSLKVQRDSTGAVIHLDSPDRAVRDQETAGYLFDAGFLKKPLKSLELEWEPSEENFIGRVSVEGSNDLEHWVVLLREAAIASLRYRDANLVQKRITFSPSTHKYLRISWPLALQKVRLTGATAETVEDTAEPARNWTPASESTTGEGSGEYTFVSPGVLPVDRVHVKLPQKNTLVSAVLYSRADEKDTWQQRAHGLLYQLHLSGEELVNLEFSLLPVTDRFWKLTVGQSGGGLGQGLPQFDLGWISQRLLFVARGDGPFLLAYGNARDRRIEPQTDDLLARFTSRHKGSLSAQPATVGSQKLLGGESRLKPSSAIPWGKWALGFVLVLSIALLAFIAVRLYRQINRSANSQEPH